MKAPEEKDPKEVKTQIPEAYHITYGSGFRAQLGDYFRYRGVPAYFNTKAEAIKAVRRRQTSKFDSEDYAVIREGLGFAVRKIHTENDPIADDIDNLVDLESVILSYEGNVLIASIIADTGEVRNFLPLPKWKPASDIDTIEEVRERLIDMMDELSHRGDHRAVFPCSYIATTNKARLVIDSIRNKTDPGYEKYKNYDDRLIENIVIEFARLYFQAFDDYESGNLEKVAPVWVVNFDEAKAQTTSVLEDMLLGYVAHICYDLSLILTKKMPDGRPLYNPDDPVHVETFSAFNRILIEETDTIIKYAFKIEKRLGGNSVNILTFGRTIGGKLLGKERLRDIVLKIFSEAREEAEEASKDLLAGRISENDFREKIARRSRRIGRLFPNSGRLFDKEG